MGADLTFDGNGLYFISVPDYPRIKGKFQSQTIIRRIFDQTERLWV